MDPNTGRIYVDMADAPSERIDHLVKVPERLHQDAGRALAGRRTAESYEASQRLQAFAARQRKLAKRKAGKAARKSRKAGG